jgi:hypothetical protein
MFVNTLLSLQLERFEDVLLMFAPSCAAKLQVYLGHHLTGSFEEDGTDGVIIFKHLWKLER